MNPTTSTTPIEPSAAPVPSGRKKKFLVIVLAVLGVAGAVYWFALRPAPEPTEPEPGEVLVLEPVQINLRAGHYLRVGIALQMSLEVEEEVDGSKALDALIDVYSGEDVKDLAKPEHREELRTVLSEQVSGLYEDEVLDVYITEFVTQ